MTTSSRRPPADAAGPDSKTSRAHADVRAARLLRILAQVTPHPAVREEAILQARRLERLARLARLATP